MLKIIENPCHDESDRPALEDLARLGAQQMLKTALEAEVAEYVAAHGDRRDEDGRALVVRNGRARARKIVTGSGVLDVQGPRVNDRRVDPAGNRCRFTSKILPPYMRRSPKVDEVLPLLYLRGLSSGDFKEALPALLGEDAAGLSASTITRLTGRWQSEYDRFRRRDLAESQYVYVWCDGIHVRIRLEEDRLCLLVMLGVREDGTKELIAVEDGYRESKESWLAVLRDLNKRGMKPPAVAVGDGALGFWSAVTEVWPETCEQRCWFHRLGNILDKLPKRLQGRAKQALREIMYAQTKADAEVATKAFEADYGAKYPKAVASLLRDRDKSLTFFDFPAEHWKHLRTTNLIESPFATVRLRQRVTKGAGSRTKGLTMAYKLLDMAQKRWRRINGPEMLSLVVAGLEFKDGVQQETKEVCAA